MGRLSMFLLSPFLLLLSTVSGQQHCAPQGVQLQTCLWEVKLQTGKVLSAGTNSSIGLDIHLDPLDGHFPIFDLRRYGVQGWTYPYFRPGQLDTFRFQGPCVEDVCRISFFNTGAGRSKQAWFLESASVIVTRPLNLGDPIQKTAAVKTWLSQQYRPHSWTITVDYCQATVCFNGQKQSNRNN